MRVRLPYDGAGGIQRGKNLRRDVPQDTTRHQTAVKREQGREYHSQAGRRSDGGASVEEMGRSAEAQRHQIAGPTSVIFRLRAEKLVKVSHRHAVQKSFEDFGCDERISQNFFDDQAFNEFSLELEERLGIDGIGMDRMDGEHLVPVFLLVNKTTGDGFIPEGGSPEGEQGVETEGVYLQTLCKSKCPL